MLGFVSAHIPWNVIPNLQLRQSYTALRDELVLPSGSTLSLMCRRKSAPTKDTIGQQLPSLDSDTLVFDGWTSSNKLDITSVIPCYMDRNWASRDVQLAFHEVDRLFFPHFES